MVFCTEAAQHRHELGDDCRLQADCRFDLLRLAQAQRKERIRGGHKSILGALLRHADVIIGMACHGGPLQCERR